MKLTRNHYLVSVLLTLSSLHMENIIIIKGKEERQKNNKIYNNSNSQLVNRRIASVKDYCSSQLNRILQQLLSRGKYNNRSNHQEIQLIEYQLSKDQMIIVVGSMYKKLIIAMEIRKINLEWRIRQCNTNNNSSNMTLKQLLLRVSIWIFKDK